MDGEETVVRNYIFTNFEKERIISMEITRGTDSARTRSPFVDERGWP